MDPNTSGAVEGPFWEVPSAFFAFASQAARDQVLDVLKQQPVLASGVPGGPQAAQACPYILEVPCPHPPPPAPCSPKYLLVTGLAALLSSGGSQQAILHLIRDHGPVADDYRKSAHVGVQAGGPAQKMQHFRAAPLACERITSASCNRCPALPIIMP